MCIAEGPKSDILKSPLVLKLYSSLTLSEQYFFFAMQL